MRGIWRFGPAGLVVGGVGLGALAVLTLLLLLDFDAGRLGHALLARAGAAAGAEVTAARVRLSPLRGVVLEDVRVVTAMSGGRVSLQARRFVFAHRLWPLLRGQVVVDRLRLESPALVLDATVPAPRPVPAPGPAAAAPALALRIREVAVTEGTVEVRERGAPPTRLAGFELRLSDLSAAGAGTALGALRGRGRFEVASIDLAQTRVSDMRGPFELRAGGLESGEVTFRTPEGRFAARVAARLDALPLRYSLVLRGDPVDLNAAAGAPGGRFGPAVLELSGQGVGTEPAGLTASGTFTMAAGTLPEVPVLAAIERALGRTRIVGAPYEPASTPLRVARGRVTIERLPLRSGPAGLEVSGTSTFEGALDLSVRARVERRAVQIPLVSAGVLDALTDPGGYVVVPLDVTGTRAAPVVRPDTRALAAQAGQGAGRSLLGKVGEKLGGIFRRR